MKSPQVIVIGGGLAGLAASLALGQNGIEVTLLEARRRLGGRASSFRDPETEGLVDFCQHVAMGCCTNFQDFCRRAGIEELFHRFAEMHFIAPDGKRYRLSAARWLPAPLHLAPALARMGYLSLRERWSLGRALLRLARDWGASTCMADWLHTQRQSECTIRRFWNPVLASALGETLDRVSVQAACKVFVDGFMSARGAYELFVPKVPLGMLYGPQLEAKLRACGVEVRLQAPVTRILGQDEVDAVELTGGERLSARQVVLALPWRQAANLLSSALSGLCPELQMAQQLAAAPITGIHLWFDRAITTLPHAVLVDRLSQWVFAASAETRISADSRGVHYYQVVISASWDLLQTSKDSLIERIVQEIQEAFPQSREARLLRHQIVTEKQAVFSPLPGSDALRPPQRTAVPNLLLAGDWTETGWPSTMESAVRSGYLAAQHVLENLGRPTRLLAPDLPRTWLTRLLLGLPRHQEGVASRKSSRSGKLSQPVAG